MISVNVSACGRLVERAAAPQINITRCKWHCCASPHLHTALIHMPYVWNACRQYGEDPRQALWAWTRSAARTLSCCAADCTPQPRAAVSTSASAADLPNVSESEEPSADAATRAATHLQSDMDSRNAACYFPMAQRAMVLRSKVTIRTAGGEYEASAPTTPPRSQSIFPS